MATTEYNDYGLDKLMGENAVLTRSSLKKESDGPGDSVLHILELIQGDHRFDTGPVIIHPDQFFAGLISKQDLIAEYANKLVITQENLNQVLHELLHAAVLLTFTTYRDEDAEKGQPCYSFFLLHLLTSLHAIIEIWNISFGNQQAKEASQAVIVEDEFVGVVLDYWITFIGVYVFQLRPTFKESRVDVTIEAFGRNRQHMPAQNKVWGEIHQILFGDGTKKVDYDCHILKCIRCLLFVQEYLKDEYGDPSIYSKMAFMMAATMPGKRFVGFPGEDGLMLDIVGGGEK